MRGDKKVLRLVMEDLEQRAELGRVQHGVDLETNNAYQEALDLCMYLRQRIEEEEEQIEVVKRIVLAGTDRALRELHPVLIDTKWMQYLGVQEVETE